MKLQDKFKKYFILPLIVGILLSIILTVTILIFNSKNFTDQKLLSKLARIEEGNISPIIYTANNVIYKKFQKTIYSLQLFKEYYFLFAQSFIEGYSKIDLDTINKYVKNSLYMQANLSLFEEQLQENISDINYDNSTYLNYAFWHYDNIQSDLGGINNTAFDYQVGSLANMIPVMRSVFETNQNNSANDLDLIYFASESTSLFFVYPVFYQNYYSNQNFFNLFKNLSNSPSCTNADGVTPNYFYFQCRDWFQQVVQARDSETTNSIVITDIYKFADSTSYSLTVCIKFNDPLVSYHLNVNNSLSTICSDININYVYDIFDYFNKELTGYFYVVKVNSNVPLYYPLIINKDIYSNLERFEFELGASYYIEELNSFHQNTFPVLIREYKDSYAIPDDLIVANKHRALQAVYQGSYMKNGILTNFTIYPIKLYCDYENYNTSSHIFSIISVSRPAQFKISIESFLQTFYPRLIVQIFLYMIIASILILISWYLIISIATNIVKPIENLKFLILGMQIKDREENTGKRNGKDKGKRTVYELHEFDKQTSKFTRKTQSASTRNPPNSMLLDNESESSEDSEDNNNDYDLDEDTTEIRSAEMNELFEILLQLKNVLTFTTNFSNSSDKSAFFNYVHAKYTFNQVSNYRGKMICDSNVGNLAMRLNKYDKAIFHFLESLPIQYQKLSSTSRQISIGNAILILNEMYSNTKKSSIVILNNRESKLKFRKRFSMVSGNSRRNTNSQNFLLNNDELSINNTNNLLFNDLSGDNWDENVSVNVLRSTAKRNTRIVVDSNKIYKDLSLNKDAMGSVANISNANGNNINNNAVGVRTGVKIGTNKPNQIVLGSPIANSNQNQENSPKNVIAHDENLSMLIESRYPKLIYAYKKFFKSMRKLLKKMKNEKFESNEPNNNLVSNNSTWLNSNSNTKRDKIDNSIAIEINEFQDKIDEYINIDLNVLKDKHSLEAFECTISDFLFEIIRQKDSPRVAEIILEYIEFLLIYKLKFDSNSYFLISTSSNAAQKRENHSVLSPKKSKNNFNYITSQSNMEDDLHNSFQKSEESTSYMEDIYKYKAEIINEIGKYFKIFDKIYENIRLNNSSSEYYKTFLDKFNTHKKENQTTCIETPPNILYQKSNYLKGKLAKYCGHYDKALEYFHRSRETMIICDASLIKKSIRQIVKIMSYIKEEIERDVAIEEEYARKNNIDLTDIAYAIGSAYKPLGDKANYSEEYSGLKAANRTVDSIGKTSKTRLAVATKGKIVTKYHRCEEIEKYISLHLTALETFQYSPKDLLLLIDVSASMHADKKKIERALKNANYFFENYVTAKDRFALFYYSKGINPMVSLTDKNYNTYTFVRNVIENLTNYDLNFGLDEHIPPNKSSHMCRAISLVYDYLKKKSFDLGEYEKWIVIFTDSFKKEYNTQKDQEILWNLKNMKEVTKEQIHIIVVGINMEKDGVKVLLDLLNDFSKKSAYIDIDNIASVKSLLKIPGKISEDFLFMNEKYECDNSKNLEFLK